MICAKMRGKISVDFVTSVSSFNLNIVSTNLWYENKNKQMDTDALDVQEIKRVDIHFMF